MKKIILFFLATLVFSCAEKLKVHYDNNQIIIEKEYFVYNNDTIPAKIREESNGFRFKTKKGKTLFQKKKFQLIELDDSFDAKTNMELHEEAKKQNLIGLESRIISSRGNHYLFQEDFDKRILESNKNRDGVLFTFSKGKVEIQHDAKVKNIDSLKSTIEIRINNFLNDELPANCLFDLNKTSKYIKLLNKYKLSSSSKVYYLNPVSNLLELFVMGIEQNSDELFEKLANSKKVQNENCFDENYLKYFSVEGNIVKPTDNNTILSEPVFIPQGLSFQIDAGNRIDFQKGGFIISYSSVNFYGTAEDSIYINSSDKTGRGFHVINANKKSVVDFISVNNQNNLSYKNWKLPSAITFYESDVEISNSTFSDNKSEDGVNVFRANYFVKNSTFRNTFSDAFDGDFSNGTIEECFFKNCGNDAIDVSGSRVEVLNCEFNEVKDKALSAGEQSDMIASNLVMKNVSLAINAKDLSSIEIKNSVVENSEVVFVVFQKKAEFGPSSIKATDIEVKNATEKYLLEEKSSLIIDKTKIEDYRTDVKQILYGNEYGKATVK